MVRMGGAPGDRTASLTEFGCYATYADLRGYCELSAQPIGRIVLALFGAGADPTALELSDRICTALQLIEHWQDIAEDRRAGRVYLPQEDLTAFGVVEAELDGPLTSPALRRLMAFQITRAAEPRSPPSAAPTPTF